MADQARDVPQRLTDEDPKLVRQFKLRNISVGLFQRSKDGAREWYIELSHAVQLADGSERKQSFVCGFERFDKIRSMAKAAIQERHKGRGKEGADGATEKKEAQKHWPVVRAASLSKDGINTRVVKSFPKLEEAQLYAKGKPLYVWHEPLDREPEKHEILKTVPAPNTKLARHRAWLLWQKETQGKFASYGRWYDREETPRVGRKVRVTADLEFRGEPRDDRISPTYRSLEQGEPDKPVFVVVVPHKTKPGIGVVKLATEDRGQASRLKHEINEVGFARQQANDNRLWEQATISPPEARAALRKLANPQAITTHIKGNTRADVIERIDPDGMKHQTVILTRAVRDPDGRIRTLGTVHDLEDLRAIHWALSKALTRDKAHDVEQERQAEPKEPLRPKANEAGQAVGKERARDVPHPPQAEGRLKDDHERSEQERPRENQRGRDLSLGL